MGSNPTAIRFYFPWNSTLHDFNTERNNFYLATTSACIIKYATLYTIYGAKRDDVMGGCRSLHNVELHSTYLRYFTIEFIRSRKMR